MAYTLPSLPYAFDALEPHIDARTMEIHHGKHHQAYVTNLNAALEKAAPDSNEKPLDTILAELKSIPEEVRTAVRNNGGGHWNHSFFWTIMTPKAGGEPSGALASAIDDNFGSFAKFQDEFAKSAAGRFGSGWAWLVRNGNKLSITSTPNQDNPIMDGASPGDILLGVDVWEHAYYLNYQNRRPDYVKAWWNTVNWDEVGSRFGG